MDLEANFLIDPWSYLIAVVSFIGFFIVAWDKVAIWLAIGWRRLSSARTEMSTQLDSQSPARSENGHLTILSLLLMGIAFSAVIFALNAKVEHLEAVGNFTIFLVIIFLFIMVPGWLVGMLAGAWINATSPTHQSDLLVRMIVGILVYLAFVTLVEFTNIHPLFFLWGPVSTLLIYRFS